MNSYITMIHKETKQIFSVSDLDTWNKDWVDQIHIKPWKDYVAITCAVEGESYGYFFWFEDASNHWGGKWMWYEPEEIPPDIKAIGMVIGASPIKRPYAP